MSLPPLYTFGQRVCIFDVTKFARVCSALKIYSPYTWRKYVENFGRSAIFYERKNVLLPTDHTKAYCPSAEIFFRS